jgi:hypothetical protein
VEKMENEEAKPEEDIDWENRTLCIDESCIGVIGPDGQCKECGKPYDSKQKESAPPEKQLDVSDTDEELAEDEEFTEDEEFEFAEDEESESKEDIDWETRTLCLDESCIGVIGPDGRCKECGKPYAEE